MQLALPPVTVGWVIALLVLILTLVFMVLGTVPIVIGALIAGCALSRLL